MFGEPNPGPNSRPTEGRSSSLEYYKKAISYYMPNQHIGWDMEAERGNPTRSLEVQNLIKSIKRLEVRRQGKPSAARRPMEMEEMRQLVDLAMASDRNQTKYYFLSYLKYQFHLMARNDCTAHLDVDGIMGNPQHRLRGLSIGPCPKESCRLLVSR